MVCRRSNTKHTILVNNKFIQHVRMHKWTRWEWAVTKMSNVNLDLLGWLNQLVLFTSLLNLGQCWTLGKQLRSIRISSGFRKDSSRSSISSGSSWNAFFSFTEELCFPVSNFDEDFIFCLVSCVWTWSSSTWTIFSSFRMFWMILLLLVMVTKLCCFCRRPQSTRHLHTCSLAGQLPHQLKMYSAWLY